MHIYRSHIRLLVNRFEACFLFYRDILEMPVRYGDEDGVYAEFKTSAVHIALFKRELMALVMDRLDRPDNVQGRDTLALVLRVDDVDAAYETLRSKGVSFDTPPVDRKDWNCRTAHFRDPDGNLIELNSDL